MQRYTVFNILRFLGLYLGSYEFGRLDAKACYFYAFPPELTSFRTEIIVWLLKVKYLPGDKLFFTLKISGTRNCRFLLCIVAALSISISSLKNKLLFWYTTRNTRWCETSKLRDSKLLNWDIRNAFIKDLHFSKSV